MPTAGHGEAPADAIDDDIALIRAAVAQVCSKFDDDYWSTCDQDHRFPREFYDEMAVGGWIGIAIPEAYGGGGRGIREAAAVLEEVAASGACMNGASAIHLSIFGMHPVVLHGSEEMKASYLPGVAAGDLHVAFGVTEPDAGTDTTKITTRAVRDGDQYVVNGRKVWTSKALEADRILLLARTTPANEVDKPHEGMSLFLVDRHASGVGATAIPKMGRNAVASCETTYDDVLVPVSDRVGEEGRGFQYLLDGLNAERILVASEALGMGRVSLRSAVDYANARVVFDRPIGRNQGIAFPLAEAHMRLEAAALMIDKAATLIDRGEACGPEANMAKYLAADAGFFAADRAVQTHGGFGYATEYHVERYFREARLPRIAPISQELVLAYVAHHVLRLPRFVLTEESEGGRVALDLNIVGVPLGTEQVSWGSTDAILYALGVGAGVEDLAFTTENTEGLVQRVLPTAAVTLGVPVDGTFRRLGDFDLAGVLHLAQELELHQSIPVEVTATNATTVTAMYDKGAHAVVVIETVTTDGNGASMFTNRTTLFVRGAGGWGGDRGPSAARPDPSDAKPDHEIVYRTSPDQALLYRLSGDRNPLHSDPAFARRGGFDRPLLHGLCGYGYTGRALLASLCEGDPDRFHSMTGRFTAVVMPGEELRVAIWEAGAGPARFETRRSDDTIVLEGLVTYS